jgi:multidrug efflux pump subunit AcrB
MDQTVAVRSALGSLVFEGIVGAVLVSIMILLFLGDWRMTLIATMSIPLAVMGAIIGLYATGNTINAMTLGGLALAFTLTPSPSSAPSPNLRAGAIDGGWVPCPAHS